MSKKISKKARAIRTISLAVGSLSLLVIAVSQVTGNAACTSSSYSIENQIRLSWFNFQSEYLYCLIFLGEFKRYFYY